MRSGIFALNAAGKRWSIAAGAAGAVATLVAAVWLYHTRPSTASPEPASTGALDADRVRQAVSDLTDGAGDYAPVSPEPAGAGLAADAATEIGLDPAAWETDPSPLLALDPETDWQVELPPEFTQDLESGRPAGAQQPGGPAAPVPVREAHIEELLRQAGKALAEQRLMLPRDTSAYAYYRQVLDLEPGNAQASEGLDRLVDRYAAMAQRAMRRGEFDTARLYLGRAEQIRPGAQAALDVRGVLESREAQARQEAAERGRVADLLRGQSLLGRQSRPVQVLRDTLQDGSPGPEMVVVPGGEYTLGPRDDREAADADETPRRAVVIGAPYALGRYEVSVAEYLRFVEATGAHAPEWLSKKGSPRYQQLGEALTEGRYPVVGISWHDAVAYARWMSEQTGESYRLPTEAEWEYAASGAVPSQYWWGDDPSRTYANYGREECCEGVAEGEDIWVYTAPVDALPPNPFGLFNTSGNVWEWTCSSYERKYSGQENQCASPDDGKGPRALRGGSWYSHPRLLRSANRYGASSDYRNFTLGFRLARELPLSDSTTAAAH